MQINSNQKTSTPLSHSPGDLIEFLEIKENDIFVYNGIRNVALDNVTEGTDCIWVTIPRYWFDPDDPKYFDMTYSVTSACLLTVDPHAEVIYEGNMKMYSESTLKQITKIGQEIRELHNKQKQLADDFIQYVQMHPEDYEHKYWKEHDALDDDNPQYYRTGSLLPDKKRIYITHFWSSFNDTVNDGIYNDCVLHWSDWDLDSLMDLVPVTREEFEKKAAAFLDIQRKKLFGEDTALCKTV